LEIRVVAEQFAWNIHYPGRDGVFGRTAPNLVTASNPVGLDKLDPKGKDDIITINQMHVPVNKDVITYLSSKDVIHCFAIPVMRVKQDTVPGQKMAISFKAVHKGQFEIACAQLCGLGHYRMKGFFVVEGKDEFDAWLAEKERAS
jgi:cytochrome c oxidase subunit II